MPEILIAATTPTGQARANTFALVALVDGGAGGAADTKVIGDTTRVRLDDNGEATVPLVGVDQIVPTGCFYRISIESSPTLVRHIVPTSATPDGTSWADPSILAIAPVPPAWTPLAGPPAIPAGEVTDSGELPGSAVVGEMWITSSDGHAWTWDGSGWVDLGQWRGSEGPEGPEAPQTDLGDLPPASGLTGAEVVPVLQDGMAAAALVDDLAGSVVDVMGGKARDRLDMATRFLSVPSAATFTSGLLANETLQVLASGTGAVVRESAPELLMQSAITCRTGTTAAGYSAAEFTQAVYTAPTSRWSTAWLVHHLAAAANSVVRCGFLGGAPSAAPTHGMYFEQTGAGGWSAVTKGPGGTTTTALGISGGVHTFEVRFDGAAPRAEFYVDGGLVAVHVDNLPGFFSSSVSRLTIAASSGTADRRVGAFGARMSIRTVGADLWGHL